MEVRGQVTVAEDQGEQNVERMRIMKQEKVKEMTKPGGKEVEIVEAIGMVVMKEDTATDDDEAVDLIIIMVMITMKLIIITTIFKGGTCKAHCSN